MVPAEGEGGAFHASTARVRLNARPGMGWLVTTPWMVIYHPVR